MNGEDVIDNRLLEIDGRSVSLLKVKHDISGNPRYIIDYRYLADTYDEALKISREFGGKKYKKHNRDNYIVFSSYSVKDCLSGYIKRGEKICQ